MPKDGSWLEIRCTASGFLNTIDLPYGDPPEGAERSEGVFSVVIEDGPGRGRRGIKRLPVFYLSMDPFFAHRELETLRTTIKDTISLAIQTPDSATYVAQACSIAAKRGIYARELYNRSFFRRKLARLGFEFSADPLLRFNEEGSFESSDTPPFIPDFIILGGKDESDPMKVMALTNGLAIWTLASFRFGRIGSVELGRLVKACETSSVVAAGDAHAVAGYLHDAGDLAHPA